MEAAMMFFLTLFFGSCFSVFQITEVLEDRTVLRSGTGIDVTKLTVAGLHRQIYQIAVIQTLGAD